MSQVHQRTIGDRALSIEVDKLALQAHGAVTVKFGDTVVLVTACASAEPREGIDFLPLTIDYEERLYAAGKIPGSFFRREGRPSTEAVLAGRLTDRPLRPLFPKGYRNDVQVVITVLSADQENDPDILAIVGASTALCMSEIPFGEPVSSVRVGYIDGQYVINPTFGDLQKSQLDLVVASTRDAVMMVEADAQGVPEDVVLGAIRFAHEANQELIALEQEVISEHGQPKKPFAPDEPGADLRQAVARFAEDRMGDIIATLEKGERESALAERRQELLERLGETYQPELLLAALDQEIKREVRTHILKDDVRPDGRSLTEIRPIACEVGLLPRTHGSGLFTRGQTQVLTIATLGSMGEEQRLDTLSPEESKRFLHHYNFPPFSVGEVRRMGSPSRRAVGHGALAERAIEPVIPTEEEFPYTIRLVSEVLSSNGSTSMASVCGSTLSLMDAGVPIKAPVAGIAMGLVMGENGDYKVLTDIAGIEDALGDMDFKVAGTAEGITALQMDIKVKGISIEIMKDALAQAREARLYLLDRIRETIPVSRTELSPYAPRMYRIQIAPEKIGTVIGPGGRVIRSIIDETKCKIDVEEDGTVYVGSTSEEMANRAMEIIKGLTKEVEVGTIYTGKVTRLLNFGAFVEIMPGKEGLVHISELADYRVPSVEDVVQVGDEIMVMVTEIDSLGRINLSRRAVLEGSSGAPKPAAAAGAPSTGGGAPPPRRGGSGGYRNGVPQRTPRRGNGRPGGFEREGGSGGGGRRRRPDRGFERPTGPPPPPRPPYGPRRFGR
jgi:polyribonucleotide nucleotidyltransferase